VNERSWRSRRTRSEHHRRGGTGSSGITVVGRGTAARPPRRSGRKRQRPLLPGWGAPRQDGRDTATGDGQGPRYRPGGRAASRRPRTAAAHAEPVRFTRTRGLALSVRRGSQNVGSNPAVYAREGEGAAPRGTARDGRPLLVVERAGLVRPLLQPTDAGAGVLVSTSITRVPRQPHRATRRVRQQLRLGGRASRRQHTHAGAARQGRRRYRVPPV